MKWSDEITGPGLIGTPSFCLATTHALIPGTCPDLGISYIEVHASQSETFRLPRCDASHSLEAAREVLDSNVEERALHFRYATELVPVYRNHVSDVLGHCIYSHSSSAILYHKTCRAGNGVPTAAACRSPVTMPAKRRSRRARTRRDSVRRRCREPRSNFLHDLHDPLMNAPRRGPWRPQHILTDIPRTCTGIRRPRDPRGAAQARESRGSDPSYSPVRVPRLSPPPRARPLGYAGTSPSYSLKSRPHLTRLCYP